MTATGKDGYRGNALENSSSDHVYPKHGANAKVQWLTMHNGCKQG